MDSERVRKELRRLLEDLSDDKQQSWRSFVDGVVDGYAELTTEAADLRAASDLAAVIREANSLQGETNAVVREATLELRRRFSLPDAATITKAVSLLAAIISPLVAAIAYVVSGGQVGSLDPPSLPISPDP
tara:strand:+ start:579 stop:971 length:393 start_codon:yes stop_codon:yes gene_type:complete